MRYLVIGLLVLGACASSSKTVEKAVKASGGNAKLAAVDSYHIAATGTYMGQPYTAISHYRQSGEWNWDMKMEGMSMRILFMDDTMYMSTDGGKAVVQEGTHRDYWIDHMRVGLAIMLPDRLLAKDVTLRKLKAVEIDGLKHTVVEARFKGHNEPVTFIFNPQTDRIRRVMYSATNPEDGGIQANLVELSDWQETDGVFIARHTYHKMGTDPKATVIQEDHTDSQWNPEIPESIFVAPEVAPPPTIKVTEQAATRVVTYVFVGPFQKVDQGIGKVFGWISENGGEPAGPVALIYKDWHSSDDYTKQKTWIQIPIKMESAPTGGDIQLMKRRDFTFANAHYEGPVSSCMMLIPAVEKWCAENGYEKSGHWRVHYLTQPDPETGLCTAEVGCPVKKSQ